MDYFIYLTAPAHLAQFIKHTFGYPAELIRDSPEARILREYLTKQPDESTSDESECNVKIRIPYFKEKDPRVYNYITPATKQVLLESFDELLKRSMYQEIGALGNVNCKLSSLIYAYMEKHGIDEKHWDTIAKKWYRFRQSYSKQAGVTI
jgi:hypothetical protein